MDKAKITETLRSIQRNVDELGTNVYFGNAAVSRNTTLLDMVGESLGEIEALLKEEDKD